MNDLVRFAIPSAETIVLEPQNRNKTEKIHLDTRPCTQRDLDEMFYKSRAEDYSDDKLSSYKNDMICLNDPNDMRLEGQYKHDDGSFLKFKLIRCQNETSDGRSCAGDEEI